ncbi:hypothetical protein GCM10028793_31820 [Nocardiopsis oceani]
MRFGGKLKGQPRPPSSAHSRRLPAPLYAAKAPTAPAPTPSDPTAPANRETLLVRFLSALESPHADP